MLQQFDVAIAASLRAKITIARLIELIPRYEGNLTSKQNNFRLSIVDVIVSSFFENSIDTLLQSWRK